MTRGQYRFLRGRIKFMHVHADVDVMCVRYYAALLNKRNEVSEPALPHSSSGINDLTLRLYIAGVPDTNQAACRVRSKIRHRLH